MLSIGQTVGDSLRSGPCALLVALVACALIAAWIGWRHESASRRDAAALSEATARDGTAGAYPRAEDPGALVPAPRSSIPPGALFAAPSPRSAQDDAPPARFAPGPAPVAVTVPPVAPALPLALLGRLRAADGWTALLSRGAAQYVVRAGDVLEGEWRVEAIDETGVEFVHLALGTRQRLQFTAADPPGIAQGALDGPVRGPTYEALARGSDYDAASTSGSNTAMGGISGMRERAGLPVPGASTGMERAPHTPPPNFERRIRPSDIPREPWVCQAARVNALAPCRNTWSMSEGERQACRREADDRYNACLRTALSAADAQE